MNAAVLTPAQANFKLTLMNADASKVSSSDLYLWLRESGLPDEVAIRLQDFVDTSVEVGGRAINIGKIVILKIIDFVKAHPNLAIGIAIGGAIGALTSMIPFLGPYLAPIATVIGITVGAIAGKRLDDKEQGRTVNSGVIGITQDIIEIAKNFFALIIDIFNAVFK